MDFSQVLMAPEQIMLFTELPTEQVLMLVYIQIQVEEQQIIRFIH